MLRRLRTFPKIPLHRIPRIPLSTTTSSSSPPPPPPSELASEPAADAEENSVVTRAEAYRRIRNLDFSTATKILFTTPPKNKKFGLDFHLVQLFFVCLPSLGVYLVAQYARYEMRRMEAEAEQKKKQAEEEEKARNELAPHEEGMSDAELSKVLVRLGALEEVVREIVEEKKRTPHADLSKKDKEVNKRSDPQSKPNPDKSKQEQNKVAADGPVPPVSASADDSSKAKDKSR